MKIRLRTSLVRIVAFCLLLSPLAPGLIIPEVWAEAPASVNITFSGTLSTSYCIPEGGPITVSFPAASIKSIYDQMYPEKTFSIRLHCQKETGRRVGLILTGTSAEGSMLSVSGVNGLGIRLSLKESGQAMAVNGPAVSLPITSDGEQELNFAAQLEGLPDAVKKHTVGTGAFTAVATLVMTQL